LERPLFYYLIACAFLSLATFIVCGYDKFAAKTNRRRAPERTLLLFSAAGGATGMLLGMLALRHKTRHMSFRILVPLFAIAHYMVGLLLLSYC